MNAKKISSAIVLFVIYEACVWGFAWQFLRETGYLQVGAILSACGAGLLCAYFWATRNSASRRPAASPPPRPAVRPFSDPSPAASILPAGPGANADPASVLLWEAGRRWEALAPAAAQKMSLSDLPLYAICGPEGTGKTSIVLASGLHPRLLGGHAVPGSATVPTPLANLWLAGDSLIVEEGGRLLAAEPAEGRTLWQHLAVGAATTNLRGVVLCCDIRELLGIPDVARQTALARSSQEHLRLIGEVFCGTLPVYVVFTQCDAIPYFNEYFGRLEGAEQEQILGCTLADPAAGLGHSAEIEDPIKRLGSAFNNLYARLAEKRLIFLRRESDQIRKAGIYEFPRELRRIRGSVVQYLASITGRQVSGMGPVLRGFYFAGVLEAGRWNFVADLFRQMVGPGAGIASIPAVDPVRRRRSNLGFALATGVAVAAGLLFCWSWLQNRSLLRATAAAATACEPLTAQSQPSVQNLAEIDALRRQVKILVHNHDRQPPLTMRLGFYAGEEVLDPALRIYLSRLRQYFLDEMAHRLETEFAALPAAESPSYPYVTVLAHLQGYRIVTGGAANASAESMAEWLLLVWRDLHPSAASDRIVQANFDFYCGELRPQLARAEWLFAPEDAALAQRAYAYLKTFGGNSQ